MDRFQKNFAKSSCSNVDLLQFHDNGRLYDVVVGECGARKSDCGGRHRRGGGGRRPSPLGIITSFSYVNSYY